MNLYHLNCLVQNTPEFKRICSALSQKSRSRTALSLPEQAYSVFAASIYEALRKPVVLVSAHPESAKKRYEQVKLCVQNENDVYYFPEIDLLASTVSIDPLVNSDRLRILSLLAGCGSDKNCRQLPPFIIASALSLASRSIGSVDLLSGRLEIDRGFRINQSALLEKLQSIGYEYDEVVEMPGTFGKRGE